jgi:outer membrane lipoprotein SlyB
MVGLLSACVAPPMAPMAGYPTGAGYPGSYPSVSPSAYPSASTYPAPYPGAQPVAAIEYGRVTHVELVAQQEQGRPPVVGPIIGGVLGAVIGHQFGRGGGRDLATIAGGVGGAVAGNAIERNGSAAPSRQLYRVSVQVDNGSMRAYDLGQAIDLRPGDRVRIENGLLYRL